jgi:nucleoside-diphosphate-sugar epimerase
MPGLFSELRQNGALFNFVRAAVGGRPLELTASGPVSWDVLHVADAAEAIRRALRAPAWAPGAVNIGHGEPVSLTLMAEYIAARGGRALPVNNVSGVVHPVFQMDITKATGLLAWKPGPLAARVDQLWSALQETVVA